MSVQAIYIHYRYLHHPSRVQEVEVDEVVDAHRLQLQHLREHRGFRTSCTRKVDVSLPGKGNFTSHGARPVHQIMSMMDQ